MKYYFDGIIIVEGSGDASYLSSLIESEYVITNGYDLPSETVEYLKTAAPKTQILIMTDADEAGFEIRKKIHTIINGVDIIVDKNCCNKNGKHGVAECTKEEVLKSLSNYLKDKSTKKYEDEINEQFLFLIGINNKEISLFIGKKFHIGICNKKTMAKRLNTLKISKNEVMKAVEEYSNGNQ